MVARDGTPFDGGLKSEALRVKFAKLSRQPDTRQVVNVHNCVMA